MYSENRVSLGLESGMYTHSQCTASERVTNTDKGPVGKAILGACFRNLSGDERQVCRKLVSRVSGGIREVVGQKVDNIATVIRPFIYIRRGPR